MIFLVVSIVLFAFNNVLWKLNLQNTNITFLVSYRALFTSVFSFSLAFYFHDFNAITIGVLGRVTLGSLFGVIGLLCMLTVLQKASLHWLGIYNLMGIVFTTLYLLLFENVSLKQSVWGAVLLVLGFCYHLYTNTNIKLVMTLKQHLLLVLMTFSFCVSSLLHWKNLAKEIPALVIISNQEFVVFACAFICTLVRHKSYVSISLYKKYFVHVLYMAGVIFLALLFSFLGLKLTNPLVSSLVFLASPLTTIVMNLFFCKDKLTFHNGIALFLVALGAFLLHYSSL